MKIIFLPAFIMGLLAALDSTCNAGSATTAVYLKYPLPPPVEHKGPSNVQTFYDAFDQETGGHPSSFPAGSVDDRESKETVSNSDGFRSENNSNNNTTKKDASSPFHPFQMSSHPSKSNAMKRKGLIRITEVTDGVAQTHRGPASMASTEAAVDRSLPEGLFAETTPSPSARPQVVATTNERVPDPVSPSDNLSDEVDKDLSENSDSSPIHGNEPRDRFQRTRTKWPLDIARKFPISQTDSGNDDAVEIEEKIVADDNGDSLLILQNSTEVRHQNSWDVLKESLPIGIKHSKAPDLGWKHISRPEQVRTTSTPNMHFPENGRFKPRLSNDSPYEASSSNITVKPFLIHNVNHTQPKHKNFPKGNVWPTESSGENTKDSLYFGNGISTSTKSPFVIEFITDRSIPHKGSESKMEKDKKTVLKSITPFPPGMKGIKDSSFSTPVLWTLSETGVGIPTISSDISVNKKMTTESTAPEKDGKWMKEPSSAAPYDKSLSSTTPDSHMNDPPWPRGPNVFPPEHDPIPEMKEIPKEEKDKQDPLVETPIPYSEPEPDWKISKKVWGHAWEAHYYSVGSLFGVLAIYSFVSLLRIRTYVRLLSRGYFMSINTTLCILGITRAVHLLYDPYNSYHSLPPAVAYVTFNIAYPCLTTAFAILFLSLLQSTKTRLLSPKVQRSGVLTCIVVFHFSFAVTTDVILGTNLGGGGAKLLRFACLVLFLVWCVVLFFGYFFAFKKLHHAALKKQGEMIRVTFTKLHIDGAQLPKKLPRPTLAMAVKVTLVCSVVGLFLAFLQLGGIVCIYGVSIWKKPDPWPWWGYQLASRLLELVVCALISFIATQPMKYFEQGNNKFCNILSWFPCSVFARCSSNKGEAFDFETHSDYYANLQGFRNCGFGALDGPRRWGQTNSLPTFRTPSSEVDNTMTMRNFPHTGRGRNTNHPSAISLLSYYRSKRNLSLSTNDGLDDLERTIGNQATLSSVSEGRSNTIRPASMLYKDKGFIRFRTDADPEQPMELTDEEDDDDNTRREDDRNGDDCDSTKANAGSSFHSLLDDDEDIVQSSLSPFFQSGYHRRLRRMSRVSLETTDNSVDLSFEHLSNMTSRNGLSSSALDFNLRKYGSTCSSESAANSFDVTFFLNGNSVVPGPPATTTGTRTIVPAGGIQQAASSSSSSAVAVTSAYRSETEDEKTSSVDGHEVMLRSVSPIVSRSVGSGSRRVHDLPLSLNFPREGDGNQVGRVNASCGTEDITPDSAVYLDIQFASKVDDDTTTTSNSSPRMMDASPHSSDTSAPDVSPEDMSPELSNSAPVFFQTSSTSQSMNDLRTSSYVPYFKARRASRSLLNKLRGSTFSLNATINGYEPLESEDNAYYPRGHSSKRRLRRATSDRRPGSAQEQRIVTPVADGRTSGSTSFGRLCQGDSGLLRDCQDCVMHVDEASQTDPTDMHMGLMTTCCDTVRLARVPSDAVSCRLMNLKE